MQNRREFGLYMATGIGALALASPGAAKATSGSNVSLNAIYPMHEGARFDMAYYRATHIPLAMKVMKADNVILIEGVPRGDAPAPYAMIAHFQFASQEALDAALARPEMADVRADVANFTDIRPTVMFGRSS